MPVLPALSEAEGSAPKGQDLASPGERRPAEDLCRLRVYASGESIAPCTSLRRHLSPVPWYSLQHRRPEPAP